MKWIKDGRMLGIRKRQMVVQDHDEWKGLLEEDKTQRQVVEPMMMDDGKLL